MRTLNTAWIGSGWPEWVSLGQYEDPERAEEFNLEINSFQSIAYLTMIVFNLIPGFWVDFCKAKLKKEHNETYGVGVGLATSFMVVAICMVVHR